MFSLGIFFVGQLRAFFPFFFSPPAGFGPCRLLISRDIISSRRRRGRAVILCPYIRRSEFSGAKSKYLVGAAAAGCVVPDLCKLCW
jgi:hypothetical protein